MTKDRLFEAGTSIFGIQEMLGHNKIESDKKDLYVHTRRMREVLFDETFESVMANHLDDFAVYRESAVMPEKPSIDH